MVIRKWLGYTFYEPEEVAERLGVSKKTIYTYIKAGTLRAKKSLRKWWIDEDSVTDLIKNKTR